MATSFYEYTKSAKDVKKFVCEEKCREIALAFDKFNAESGVYEFFGDVLLEVAKEHYEMTFESTSIESYLKDKGLEPPEFKKIEIEEHWYDESQDIRAIGQKFKCDEVMPDYYWYTLWKIAKEYNRKNGCVVDVSPRAKYDKRLRAYYFDIFWDKDAEECCSKDRWKKKAESMWPMKKMMLFGMIIGAFSPFLLWLVLITILFLPLGEKVSVISSVFFRFNFFIPESIISFAFLVSVVFRKIIINFEIEQDSFNFEKHCKNIQENRESRYYLD